MIEVEEYREAAIRRTALESICAGLEEAETAISGVLSDLEEEIEGVDPCEFGGNPVECGRLRAQLKSAARLVRWLNEAVDITACQVTQVLARKPGQQRAA